MSRSVSWPVERVRGMAGTLHQRGVPATPDIARTIEVLEVERPALVLGSTQPPNLADGGACERAGVEVARRQSGGGVVLVDPLVTLWIDVLLPARDPLWMDDVTASAAWLGGAWSAALRAVGAVADPAVHEGSMCLSRWGRLVCFAGLGPGEVTAGPGGAKVVGISQRRTRYGARFQCAVLFEWDPSRVVSLLQWTSEEDRAEAAADLAQPGVVQPVAADLRGPLLDAFLAALPA